MTSGRPRAGGRAAGTLALVIVLTGCGALPSPGVAPASLAEGGPAVPPVEAPAATGVPVVAVMGALAAAPTGAAPVLLEVPALGLARPPVPLGLDPSGSLEVPADPADVGWYVHSAEPGDPGPAVVAGHVDSREGPGVFHRLDDLEPGDEVRLRRGDGRVAVFRVDRVEQHPKAAFPTEAVYGPTPGPELRLITCGGEFDRTSSHYRDNVLVYASLASLT